MSEKGVDVEANYQGLLEGIKSGKKVFVYKQRSFPGSFKMGILDRDKALADTQENSSVILTPQEAAKIPVEKPTILVDKVVQQLISDLNK